MRCIFFLQDFTLDVYFRQYWTDDRLSFQRQRGVEILSVSTEYLRNMWVPDTFFPNEKTAYLHTVTTSNEFVRIRHDGEISRSMRLLFHSKIIRNTNIFIVTVLGIAELQSRRRAP